MDRYTADRRMRVAVVDQDEVAGVVFSMATVRYRLRCVPEDCEVVSVHHDPRRLVFVFTLRHESFAQVPVGEPVPEFLSAFEAGDDWDPSRRVVVEAPEADVHELNGFASGPCDAAERTRRLLRVVRGLWQECPTDARVDGVHHLPRERLYRFDVAHPTFEPRFDPPVFRVRGGGRVPKV